MKHLQLLLFSFLFISFTFSQEDLQIVKIKNDDKSVSLSIINHSSHAYVAEVTLDMEGMKLEKPMAKNILINGNTTVQLGKLLPTSKETSFKVNIKASPKNNTLDVIEFTSPNVIFYSKNNQSESTQIRIFLQKNDINYIEYNASYNKKSKEIFNQMMERRGLERKKVKLPVLIIDGEVFYNVENWQKFLKKQFK